MEGAGDVVRSAPGIVCCRNSEWLRTIQRSSCSSQGQTSTRMCCIERACQWDAQQAGARQPGSWPPLGAGEVLPCVLFPSVYDFSSGGALADSRPQACTSRGKVWVLWGMLTLGF